MELPVLLIQALHERQVCVQTELETIATLQAQETRLREELQHVTTLLAHYPLPTNGDAPLQEGTDEVPCTRVRVGESGRVEIFPAPVNKSDAPLSVSETPPAPEALPIPTPTLDDHIAAILKECGPSNAAYLRRTLRMGQGIQVAESTLYDHLQRGLKRGLYVRTNKLWRLAPAATPKETV